MFRVGNGESPEIIARKGVCVVYGCVLVPRTFNVHSKKLTGVMCRCGLRQV